MHHDDATYTTLKITDSTETFPSDYDEHIGFHNSGSIADVESDDSSYLVYDTADSTYEISLSFDQFATGNIARIHVEALLTNTEDLVVTLYNTQGDVKYTNTVIQTFHSDITWQSAWGTFRDVYIGHPAESGDPGMLVIDHIAITPIAREGIYTVDWDNTYATSNETVVVNMEYKTSAVTNAHIVQGATSQSIATTGTYTMVQYTFANDADFAIHITGEEGAYLALDYINVSIVRYPVDSALATVRYEVSGVPYEENVTLSLVSSALAFTFSTLRWTWDSTLLIHYDHVNDLEIVSENLTLWLDLALTYDAEYYVTLTSNEWIVPSSVNLTLNGNLIIDETYNSGYVVLSEYPVDLAFSAGISSIAFNFSLLTYVSFAFELDPVSPSYLRHTLVSSADVEIYLDSYEIAVTTVRHLYINNADYGTASSATDIALLVPACSSLKWELILSDTVYLPLCAANSTSVSSNSSYKYLSNESQIVLTSPNYPASATISVDSIMGYEDSSIYNLQGISHCPSSVSTTYGITNSTDLDLLNDTTNSIEYRSESIDDNGHYKGIQTFRNGTVNTLPADWSLEYAGTQTGYGVTDGPIVNHQKVMRLSASGDGTYLKNTLTTIANGTMEFMFLVTNGAGTMYFPFRGGATPNDCFMLTMSGSKFYHYPGNVLTEIVGITPTANTWYYVRITFDRAAGTNGRYWLSINGTTYANCANREWKSGVSDLRYWRMYLRTAMTCYVDSVCPMWQDGRYVSGSLVELEFHNELNVSHVVATGIEPQQVQQLNVSLTYTCNQSVAFSYRDNIVLSNVELFGNESSGFYTYETTESHYGSLYLNTTGHILFNLYGYNDTVFGNYSFTFEIRTFHVNITYYNPDSLTSLRSFSLSEAEIALDEIVVSGDTTFTLDSTITITFTTPHIVWFNVTVENTYNVTSNRIQWDNQTNTDSTSLSFRYFWEADRSFGKWYYTIPGLAVNGYTTYFVGNTIPTAKSSDNFYFSQNLQDNDIIISDAEIDPGFAVDSQTMVNNGTYCKLRVVVSCALYIKNVTVYVDDFDAYFDEWANATQNSASKRITFYVTSINETSTFYLEGTRETPWANITGYAHAPFWVQANETNDVLFNAHLGFSDYSESFRIPTNPAWTLDGVHYQNQSYNLYGNTIIFTEGWDASISSAFLQFNTDPITEYYFVQTNDSINLRIESSLPLEGFYIIFEISGLKSYRVQNNSVEKLMTLNDIDYYYVAVATMSAGTHDISFGIQAFSISTALWILIPIAVVGVIYVYRYYAQKGTDVWGSIKAFFKAFLRGGKKR